MEEVDLRESSLKAFWSYFTNLVNTVGIVVKGKREEVGMAFMALFAGGHVLLEDNPGTGKTTLAKSMAAVIGGQSNRVQFTPDLLPADVTGGTFWNQHKGEFGFKPGPVFTNVLLADEINRASPKTQSSLLQVMEEGEVTVDRDTYAVGRPFVVLATQNPIEQEGTYRLPEAQVDRFMIKLSLGYPDNDAEVDMLQSIQAQQSPKQLQPQLDPNQVKHLIRLIETVQVSDPVNRYIVELCSFTRSEAVPEARLGVSPRGAVALMRMARVMAATRQRVFVTIDDVKTIAPYVMAHRILLTPDAELAGVSPEVLVERALTSVRIPESAAGQGSEA